MFLTVLFHPCPSTGEHEVSDSDSDVAEDAASSAGISGGRGGWLSAAAAAAMEDAGAEDAAAAAGAAVNPVSVWRHSSDVWPQMVLPGRWQRIGDQVRQKEASPNFRCPPAALLLSNRHRTKCTWVDPQRGDPGLEDRYIRWTLSSAKSSGCTAAASALWCLTHAMRPPSLLPVASQLAHKKSSTVSVATTEMCKRCAVPHCRLERPESCAPKELATSHGSLIPTDDMRQGTAFLLRQPIT